MADPTSLPESLWHWLGELVVGVLTVLVGVIGWNFRDVKLKGDKNGTAIAALQVQAATFVSREDLNKDFVARREFTEMDVKVAGLASRRELIAYLREQREQQQRWEAAQQQQHVQNQDTMREIKAASEKRDQHAQEFRTEMRDAIGKLAIKVTEVATIQAERTSQKSS